MLVFPNCKINLSLNIVGKRADGYHELESIFYPVPLTDALEIINDTNPPGGNSNSTIKFTSSGLPVAGSSANNLCVKAWHLLQQDFPGMPSIQLHLHKVIPMGAGLGGGSSDGSFALQLINQHLGLNLAQPQLHAYALQLGSDCPFFLVNKPCFATGRGEQLQPANIDLAGYHLVLVSPGIHISTQAAFARIRPKPIIFKALDVIEASIKEWKNKLTNDFETGVFDMHPQLAKIKAALYQAGALYASMTGTGSTIYGIFAKDQLPAISFEPGYFVRQLLL